MTRLVFFLASFIVSALAACNYELKNKRLEPCNGQAPKEWTLSGIDYEFNDKCDVLIKGCIKINSEINNLKIDYKAFKNGAEITKGTKEVCGMKMFDTKFECPFQKGKNVCATEKWIQEVPSSMLSMAVGNIKTVVTLTSSAGKACYNISVDVKKRKMF